MFLYNRTVMLRKDVVTKSADATQAVAEAIGARCRGGEVMLLVGDLGAGKTCFTQGLARGLGVEGYVHSPTFVLATEHTGRLRLRHVDLYRIEGAEETLDLGLDEFGAGDLVGVVEWADRASGVYPLDHMIVALTDLGGDERELVFKAAGERHEALLAVVDPIPVRRAG